MSQSNQVPHQAEVSNQNPTQNKKKGGAGKLLLLVVILIALGIAGLLAIRFGVIAAPGWLAKNLPPQVAPLVNQVANLDSEEAKLALMMETGRSGICTMKNTETGEEAVYYVKGDKFKVESTSTDEETDEMIQSFVINDGEYLYTWSNIEEKGVKYRNPSEEEMEEMEEDLADLEDFDFDWSDEVEIEEDDDYDVNCRFRNVADNEFVPPTNIEFVDFSEGFEGFFEAEDAEMESAEAEGAEQESGTDSFEMPSAEDLEGLEEWAQEMEERYGDMQ